MVCELCNIQLTSKKEMSKHVRSSEHLGVVTLRKKQVMLRLNDPDTPAIEEDYRCDLCIMKFPLLSMYNTHVQWKCPIEKLINKIQTDYNQTCESGQMNFYSERVYEAHPSTKRHRNNQQCLKSKSLIMPNLQKIEAVFRTVMHAAMVKITIMAKNKPLNQIKLNLPV